ncbi:mitochondrial glycoprotein [Apodospora peruviana]|uniref:Mitochondrial glycoprotein n=1 Tax=Apodospora peruviana TaxID=516989 RepID=A0AAE0ICA1_9PEZI|nr:mitochondrial glycoprotein [Apodospora peruviana]
MMSLRAFARSAPRALTRVSSSSSSAAARSQSAIRTSTLLSTRSALLRPQQASAFSTSLLRRSALDYTVDEELSQKLQSEIEYEKDVKENEPMPASVKDFLDNGPFEIEDVLGKEEVVLTRTYGNEKITVSFSIADLHNYDPDMYEEDNALADEEVEGKKEAENDLAAEADGENFEEETTDNPVRCSLNVVVEKPGKGALSIEAIAEDGAIVVENVYFYKDPAMARAADPSAAHAAQAVYPGPPFGTLDEDLQVLMERYLEDRGINQELALFVPDYMDLKEEKEYLAWLKNVKSFVDSQ